MTVIILLTLSKDLPVELHSKAENVENVINRICSPRILQGMSFDNVVCNIVCIRPEMGRIPDSVRVKRGFGELWSTYNAKYDELLLLSKNELENWVRRSTIQCLEQISDKKLPAPIRLNLIGALQAS